jgi:hypothetical protein
LKSSTAGWVVWAQVGIADSSRIMQTPERVFIAIPLEWGDVHQIESVEHTARPAASNGENCLRM